jgi:hypothetical protein
VLTPCRQCRTDLEVKITQGAQGFARYLRSPRMITFNGTQYAEPVLGYGGHGEFI